MAQAYAATLGYDQILGGTTGYDTLTVVLDYTSPKYATVGSIEGINPVSFNLGAAYTKRFTHKFFVSTNASYRKSRSTLFNDSYSLSTTANYRFNREWTLQVGAEYVKTGFPGGFARNNGFGVTVGLIWQPAYDRRAEARYNSLRNNGSARYQKTADNRVGSYGYSLATTYTRRRDVDRRAARLCRQSFRREPHPHGVRRHFGNIGDNHVTTFRVGSSIAYAGGQSRGRAHDQRQFCLRLSAQDAERIARSSLATRWRAAIMSARAEPWGRPCKTRSTAFINQSVRYDVIDPPRGYDIGEGVKRVRPAYKSGYVIEVGSAAFVSAIGTLKGRDGLPLKLVSGIMRRTDVADAKEEAFFTNTAGRFAIAKLEPGAEYSVQFPSGGHGAFTFRVPEDNDGLLELGVVELGRKEGP